MKVKNSLSSFLEQSVILNNNSLEMIDKMSKAITSSEDSVNITITDVNDSSKSVEYTVPSLGYLKSEIDRLSKSLETMTNITNGSGSSIRLSDGSYRKIIASKIPSEAPTITTLDNIKTFNFKSNWFFEDMLNPCLYVTWDMSSQISSDTERIMIQRFILKCDTSNKVEIFNKNFKDRNDIDYKSFLSMLVSSNIKYVLDDEIKDVPPRSRRYYGNFSVIRIETEKDLNGNNVKRYILTGLEFTDSKSGFENTRILTVGDYVEVNSTPASTRYQVTYVDASEKKIGLKCIEGCESVKIGADTLRISSSQDTAVTIDIPISIDEREIIFVKSIDPSSGIPSSKWSPGVGFYSNELTYKDTDGNTQTLQRFYQKNVTDFGQVLLSYASDYYPSSREGIKPSAPVLNYSNGEGDFKIVRINTQLTETTDSTTFRELIADKVKIESELNNIASEISKQKETIQTTNYTSTNEKLNAQSVLSNLVSTQETLTSNYNSVVNNIKSKYDSGNYSSPKYRVRGFWDVPSPKVSVLSGEQKIIKFKIRYRYLSESGNTNKEEEFTYKSGDVDVTGRFSNWVEIESKTRERVKTSSGWEWEDIDTSDPDKVNINQVDISIQQGEQVEIQVKSVSEAGWPSNPLESDWSNSITVAFSDFPELESDDVESLIQQNMVDAAVANVTQVYSGMSEHMKSSFYTNDKYFAHGAENITSGFLSEEQTPITLYDKLQELQSQINALVEYINGTEGEISVTLVENSDDDSEKIYNLTEGGTTYINAGDYKSAVAKLDENQRQGAIINKVYYLDISTDSESGLLLLSKLTGDRYSMCPSTIKNDNGYVKTDVSDGNKYSVYDNTGKSKSSSAYYNEQGRYDLVPINLTNTDVLDFQVGSPNMYQSAQCRGQFVYSRFRNIGDTFDMYVNCQDGSESDSDAIYEYDAIFDEGDEHVTTYYYNEGYTSGGTLNTSDILADFNTLAGSTLTNYNSDMIGILNRIPKTWDLSESVTLPTSRSSRIKTRIANNDNGTLKTFTKQTLSILPKCQTAYGYSDLGNSLGLGNFETTHKIGYEDKDRYTIGENSCNSFLFLSPVNHSSIQVDGDTSGSGKKISTGNSLRVPVIYQFRMKDYANSIFGDSTNKETDLSVKNKRFANIIGLDIWTDRNADSPKQYDIVIYSTYDTSTITDVSTVSKKSTRTITSAGTKIAATINRLVSDNKTLTSKNVTRTIKQV